jgi:hypothetical protein
VIIDKPTFISKFTDSCIFALLCRP